MLFGKCWFCLGLSLMNDNGWVVIIDIRAEMMPDELPDRSEVASFDVSKLKHVEMEEKKVLPTKSGEVIFSSLMVRIRIAMKINKDFCNFLNILFSHVHCILSHVLWFTHQLQTTLTSLKYQQMEWPFGCPKCFLQELNSVSMEYVRFFG